MAFRRGRRLTVRTVITSITALLSALALAVPAAAVSTPAVQTSDDTAVRAAAVNAALADLMPVYAHLSDNLVLDYGAASADPAVKRATLDDFAVGLIAGGGSVVGAGSVANQLAKAAERLSANLDAAILACEGRNGWRNFWPTIFLDSCNSNALAAAMAAGAGVAALAALITAATGAGPVVAGTIAAALGIYSALVALCNSWGHGIQIFVNPLGGTPVCWSQ